MQNYLYNRYNDYLKSQYGERVQKITINGGFTCPNRDGKVGVGGCSYCNNESFSPTWDQQAVDIKKQIENGIKFSKKRYKNVSKFLAYFQPYSNTYAPLSKLKELYQKALSHKEVIGLSIGTRPDCVDQEKIDYLESLVKEGFDITIEYGLETISDKTLKRINRGHDFQSFLNAISLTANRGIKICVHLIIGFPGEDQQLWIETAKILSSLPVNSIKLHHLHLVKDTQLLQEYLKQPFHLMSSEEYIDVVINFLSYLRSDIVVQRLFGEARSNTIYAPIWTESTSALNEKLCQKMKNLGISQGSRINL